MASYTRLDPGFCVSLDRWLTAYSDSSAKLFKQIYKSMCCTRLFFFFFQTVKSTYTCWYHRRGTCYILSRGWLLRSCRTCDAGFYCTCSVQDVPLQPSWQITSGNTAVHRLVLEDHLENFLSDIVTMCGWIKPTPGCSLETGTPIVQPTCLRPDTQVSLDQHSSTQTLSDFWPQSEPESIECDVSLDANRLVRTVTVVCMQCSNTIHHRW